MRERRHLVVFLRAPRLGRVKSRLAAGIGPLAALRFYRLLGARLLRALSRDRRWTCHIAVTPDGADDRSWPRRPHRLGQGRGDLGARMARVFRQLPPGPVVIIGSDIPALRPAHVVRAFRALGDKDAVFGPAGDGGYWLVGLRRRPRLPHRLFTDVRWSSAQAFADTLASLPRGFSVALLDQLEDIDDIEDYRRFRSTCARQGHGCRGRNGMRS
jgi:rSAM/selenodomain-associated transferase 1